MVKIYRYKIFGVISFTGAKPQSYGTLLKT